MGCISNRQLNRQLDQQDKQLDHLERLNIALEFKLGRTIEMIKENQKVVYKIGEEEVHGQNYCEINDAGIFMEGVDKRFDSLVDKTRHISEFVKHDLPLDLVKTPRELNDGFHSKDQHFRDVPDQSSRLPKLVLSPDLLKRHSKSKEEFTLREITERQPIIFKGETQLGVPMKTRAQSEKRLTKTPDRSQTMKKGNSPKPVQFSARSTTRIKQ